MSEENKPDEDAGASQTVVLTSKPKPYFQILQEMPGQIRVEVLGGPMDGLRTMISADALTVGRAGDNDLTLPLDMRVSSHHARIVGDGLEFWLEDLGSRNGTFLGDKRVKRRAPIRPGAVFVVGGTALEFMPR